MSPTQPMSHAARGSLPAPVRRTIAFFESISPDSVPEIRALYAPDAFFKDPFNAVRGLPAIERIFLHMFEQVKGPRFVVRQALADDRHAFLEWDFLFEFRRGPRGVQRIHGATRLTYDTAGRIVEHRDFWDAAEELYEKLPVLGTFMRFIKRQAG